MKSTSPTSSRTPWRPSTLPLSTAERSSPTSSSSLRRAPSEPSGQAKPALAALDSIFSARQRAGRVLATASMASAVERWAFSRRFRASQLLRTSSLFATFTSEKTWGWR